MVKNLNFVPDLFILGSLILIEFYLRTFRSGLKFVKLKGRRKAKGKRGREEEKKRCGEEEMRRSGEELCCSDAVMRCCSCRQPLGNP